MKTEIAAILLLTLLAAPAFAAADNYFPNNVGIGTVLPVNKLEVIGKAYFGTGTPNTNHDFQIYGTTSDSTRAALHVANLAGTTALYARNDGNVGIGTAGPGSPLHVYSTADGIAIFEGNDHSIFYIKGTDNSEKSLNFDESGTLRWKIGMDNAPAGTTDDFIIKQTNNGNAEFTINTAGNVGIGTTSPATFKLQIAGSIGPNANAIYDLGSAALGWHDLFFANTASNLYMAGGNLWNAVLQTASLGNTLDANTQLITNIGHANTDFTSGGGLNIAGNVGIGTTGPASGFKLDVAGNVMVTNLKLTGPEIWSVHGDMDAIKMPISPARPYFQVFTADASNVQAERLRITRGAAQGSASMTIYEPLTVERATYLATVSGNVGIGTTGPGYKLDVNGDGYFASALTSDIYGGFGPSRTNLATYTSFETGNPPTGWSLQNGGSGGSLARSSADKIHGTYSMLVTSGTSWLTFNQDVTVTPNTQYTFSIWAKTSTANNAAIIVYDPVLGNQGSVSHPGDGQWHRLSLTYTTGSGVTVVTFKPGNSVAATTAYFDAAQVEQASTAYAYIPTEASAVTRSSGLGTSQDLTAYGNAYLATYSGNVGIGTTNPAKTLQIAGPTGGGAGARIGDSSYYMDISVGGGSNNQIMIEKSAGTVNIQWNTAPMFTAGIGLTGGQSINWQGTGTLSTDAGSGNHLILSPGGNVGIGTTVPGTKLQITGAGGSDSTNGLSITGLGSGATKAIDLSNTGLANDGNHYLFYRGSNDYLSMDGVLKISNEFGINLRGSETDPGIFFANENTGFFSPAADQLAVTTNSVERVRIDSAGNVGIGTTGPLRKLDVTGSVSTANSLNVISRPNEIRDETYRSDDITGWGSISGGAVSVQPADPANGFHTKFTRFTSNADADPGDRIWGNGGAHAEDFVIGKTYLISFMYRATNGFDIADRDARIALLPANTGKAQYFEILWTDPDTQTVDRFMVRPGASYGGANNNQVDIAELTIQNIADDAPASRFFVSADPDGQTWINNGNVGIGTTGPGSALQVAGSTGIGIGEDKTAGTANTAGTLKFFSAGDNAYSTTFTAGTQTADAAYTLPTSSTNGLLKNTAGALSWDTNSYLTSASIDTSAELAAIVTDEIGSGKLVFDTSPILVTPTLGVATATSINKVAITAPATSATLTIANGKTLTASNTLTFTGTDGSSVAFGAGGTAAYTSNKLNAFAATTSAELAGVISDKIGTGALVFGTSPTFTTSVIMSDGATIGQAAGPLVAFDDTNNYLEITGANVGIGTTVPDIKLDVVGDGTYTAAFMSGNVGIGTRMPIAQLTVIATTSRIAIGGSTNVGDYALIESKDDSGSGYSSSANDLVFYTSGNNENGTWAPSYNHARAKIDTYGRLGVGVTSPIARLHVLQNAAADAFRVDDAMDDTTPFKIDQNGNVGIGTTSPTAKLAVAGVNNIDPAYPDGLVATPVAPYVQSGWTYTVPSGKTLYISSIFCWNSAQTLRISEDATYDNSDNVANCAANSGTYFSTPLVAAANWNLRSAGENINIVGFLVDTGVTPVAPTVQTAFAYTVPSGKTLYIRSIFCTTGAQVLRVSEDGVNDNSDDSANCAANSGTSFPTPLVVAAGWRLTSSTNDGINIIGHLTNSAGTGGP